MAKLIVGLTGAAGSGKDTVASDMTELHGFTRVAFADAVRDAALALDPIVDYAKNVLPHPWTPIRLSHVVGTLGWDRAKRASEYPEVRRLLQVIGTEVGREILGANCWVDIAARKIDALGPDAKVVITDVRFPNEVDFVRELGGCVTEIIRPKNPDAIAATHASEQLRVRPDFVLNNDGGLRQLSEMVSAFVGWVRYTYSYYPALVAEEAHDAFLALSD